MTTTSAAGASPVTASESSSAVDTRRTCTPGKLERDLDVRGHQGDIGAALRQLAGDRDALPARGAVAEETNGIERLAGAAGGHDGADTGQRTGAGWDVGVVVDVDGRLDQGQRGGGDLRDLGQPPWTGIGAGEPAIGRVEHERSARAQRGDVGLGRRVQPHLGVHRRGEQHRAGHREQGGGEQVVGLSGGSAGEQVRRRRCHDREVDPAAEVDVLGLGRAGEDVGVDLVPGEGLPGGATDELQRGRGGHDVHVVPRLGEQTEEGRRLVGGDASSDSEQDAQDYSSVGV